MFNGKMIVEPATRADSPKGGTVRAPAGGYRKSGEGIKVEKTVGVASDNPFAAAAGLGRVFGGAGALCEEPGGTSADDAIPLVYGAETAVNMGNSYDSYYENSRVDNHLNTVVIGRFSRALQEIIAESAITITEKERTETEPSYFINLTFEIKRRMFLLSGAETGYVFSHILAAEGKRFAYFTESHNRRIATRDGAVAPWLLRAQAVAYQSAAAGITPKVYKSARSYLIQIAQPDGTLATDHYPLPTDHCILGGPALVRDIPGAARIYGSDRYATNQALRETLFFNDDTVYIADGDTLVDALTGAALAGRAPARATAGARVYVLGAAP
jgi:hypothetical protein